MSTFLLILGIGSLLAAVLLIFAVMRSGQVSEVSEQTEQGKSQRRPLNHSAHAPSEPGKHPAWLFYVADEASPDTHNTTEHECL